MDEPTVLPMLLANEVKPLRLEFDGELEESETISVTAMTCTVKRGTDAAPAEVFLGAAQVVGRDVVQRVQWRAPGVVYELRCLATGSTGLKHVIRAWLPCE